MPSINYTTFSIGDILTIISVVANSIIGLPIIYRFTKAKIIKRKLKQLLNHDIVNIHIPSRDIGRPKPVVAMEDYNTYESLRKILNKYSFKTNIKYVKTNGDIELIQDESNIVVCGPKNSYLIKETFDSLPGIDFLEDNSLWYFTDETNNKFISPMDRNPPKNSDLAFLGKVRIYSKSYSPVLLICGIHALGSLGIASLLNKPKKLEKILKKVNNNNFYCLIKSSYSEDNKDIIETEIYLPTKIIN